MGFARQARLDIAADYLDTVLFSLVPRRRTFDFGNAQLLPSSFHWTACQPIVVCAATFHAGFFFASCQDSSVCTRCTRIGSDLATVCALRKQSLLRSVLPEYAYSWRVGVAGRTSLYRRSGLDGLVASLGLWSRRAWEWNDDGRYKVMNKEPRTAALATLNTLETSSTSLP